MNEEILARFERRSREKREQNFRVQNKQYSNCFSQREIILAENSTSNFWDLVWNEKSAPKVYHNILIKARY